MTPEELQKHNDEVMEQAAKLHKAGVAGRIGISGKFQFNDKDGNLVKEIEIVSGSVPLDRVVPLKTTFDL